jgi:hypothetical protein
LLLLHPSPIPIAFSHLQSTLCSQLTLSTICTAALRQKQKFPNNKSCAICKAKNML